MEIKNVQLQILEAIPEGAMEDGLAIPSRPEIVNFLVDVEGEGGSVVVPTDPNNSQYWLVKEWYDSLGEDEKPFNFEFAIMPEPNFGETIYPPTPEEVAEFLDTEDLTPVNEELET